MCIADYEVLLKNLGLAATKLKARLDLLYEILTDAHGRRFHGQHDTLFSLCPIARSIFQQLAGSGDTKRHMLGSANRLSRVSGHPDGRVTGRDMRHLLLLLPYILFDLIKDEIDEFNQQNQTVHINPSNKLIPWVLLLLEWYRLYRY